MRSGDGTQPVLAAVGGSERREERWWERVVDMLESKHQLMLALPMVLTNVFYNLIPLVSIMFAGHLGELQLASSTLANSWATVTGFAFMVRFLAALYFLSF